MSLESRFNTLDSKRFFCPTRLVWGVGTRGLAIEAMEGATSLLLVVDGGMAEHPEVQRLAERLPVAQRILVHQEPSRGMLEAAIANLPGGLDGLVCIGGGSTIDTGKALRAHLAFGAWGVKDHPPVPGMPRMVAIPTTAASGSEMSRYYVVSEEGTHEKRAYRSWSLAPDLALLDPLWLEDLPGDLRFAGALDAFTHLYESLVCRQERSWLNDALCREGLAHLLDLAPALLRPDPLPIEAASRLQYAAALGGLALSNVRTGLLHDAGEALAAQVPLPHPLTLRVFLPALLALHAPILAERLAGLAAGPKLAGRLGWTPFWVEGTRAWGLEARIHGALLASRPDPDPIVAKILSDRVLMEKESPVPLDERIVRRFVTDSLTAYLGPSDV
jgi:alcohol dehydrogenase class IV